MGVAMNLLRMRPVTLLTLMMLAFSATAGLAQTSATVESNRNTEPEVTGYTVSWGPRPGFYNASADAGNNARSTVTGLDPDQRYYFVVQAYTGDGLRSLPSSEASNNGLIVQTGGALTNQRPALFWHNKQTGRVLTWHLNGTAVVDTRSLSISGIPDTNWKIAGTGDLNGDKFSDIVWRHATEGWLAVWFLQNNTVIATQYPEHR